MKVLVGAFSVIMNIQMELIQALILNVPSLPGGYKISPRPCEVSGVPGTCMFVWECLKTEGQVRTNQITASGHVTAVLISYWPAPGHVHGRLHVRELLRARHPGQPHPGPGPHHQQGEQQGFFNCFSVLLTFRLHNQQNNKRDLAT